MDSHIKKVRDNILVGKLEFNAKRRLIWACFGMAAFFKFQFFDNPNRIPQ